MYLNAILIFANTVCLLSNSPMVEHWWLVKYSVISQVPLMHTYSFSLFPVTSYSYEAFFLCPILNTLQILNLNFINTNRCGPSDSSFAYSYGRQCSLTPTIYLHITITLLLSSNIFCQKYNTSTIRNFYPFIKVHAFLVTVYSLWSRCITHDS